MWKRHLGVIAGAGLLVGRVFGADYPYPPSASVSVFPYAIGSFANGGTTFYQNRISASKVADNVVPGGQVGINLTQKDTADLASIADVRGATQASSSLVFSARLDDTVANTSDIRGAWDGQIAWRSTHLKNGDNQVNQASGSTAQFLYEYRPTGSGYIDLTYTLRATDIHPHGSMLGQGTINAGPGTLFDSFSTSYVGPNSGSTSVTRSYRIDFTQGFNSDPPNKFGASLAPVDFGGAESAYVSMHLDFHVHIGPPVTPPPPEDEHLATFSVYTRGRHWVVDSQGLTLDQGHSFVGLFPPQADPSGREFLWKGFCASGPPFAGLPGRIVDETNTPWDYRITYSITPKVYDRVLEAINVSSQFPPNYHAFNFNCLDWAKSMAAVAGVQLPSTQYGVGITDPDALRSSLAKIGAGNYFAGGLVGINPGANDAPPPALPEINLTGATDASHQSPAALARNVGLQFTQTDLSKMIIAAGTNVRMHLSLTEADASAANVLAAGVPGLDLASVCIYSIDWGDGADYDVEKLEASHVYNTSGLFHASLAVIDNQAVRYYPFDVAVGRFDSSHPSLDFSYALPVAAASVPEPASAVSVCSVMLWWCWRRRGR